MSLITDSHRFELRRAGWTDRQINTMAQKFYNLRNISPYTAEEYDLITKSAEVMRQLNELLSAATNLLNVKGRHHTEQAYKQLEAVVAKVKP